ncbi:MAG: MoaD/ThiS family protein [Roseivirga sp.]|nr:MoaD/ThiS family protein [Roseivirga sp.]
MNIEIVAFGIAKDILKGKSIQLEVASAATVEQVKKQLVNDYPDFQTLASLQLAVNAEYVVDDYVLNENDEVVLIPPVSGG